MNIVQEVKDTASKKKVGVFRVEGRLDATSSPQLEKTIHAYIDKGGNRILIDCTRVDYLSSAGMRLLLNVSKILKSKGGGLLLCCIHEDVREIIQVAGFASILNIFPSEKEALNASDSV